MSTLRTVTIRLLQGATSLTLACIASVPFAFAQPPVELAIARSAGDADLQWGPCPAFFPAGCEIAALHGNPAQPNSDVLFRVPGEYDLPAHWHTSPERMVLIAGKMQVAYEGQAAIMLEPGMYAYGPAKAVHSGRCTSREPCVLFIAFEGPVDATQSVAPVR